ncbi:MAG: copper transporter [Acidimicrobiia bacterium]|nr:copper transporter [Acidimicrobiia bacterium]
MRDAGASAPVVLWVEPSWELGDLEAARSMADALGAVVRGDVAMRATAWTAIARRLAEGTAPEDGPDVLANLVGAGFLRAEPVEAEGEEPVLGTYPGPGARVLLVSGTGAELAVEDPVVGATTALVREQVPTVVGEVYSDGEDTPERGTTVEPIRGDEELASDVSTVDDLDLVVGRATVVLALEDLASGVVGHYGYGVGADRSIPGWTPP